MRGVHTAILDDAARLILGAEDIGRHNTIDQGDCKVRMAKGGQPE
ncbi:MAG: formate dehydrogenase accessory sulfurtransferase FdhD [Anaerolineae bacterium]|nr:formate dehydrogenase accessory sulfurtransferase FdhD [Anaerolineae bacterium]